MKNRKTTLLIVLISAMILLLGGIAAIIVTKQAASNQEAESDVPVKGTFGEFTKIDVFQNIPALTGKNIAIGRAADYGKHNYVLDVNGVTLDEYKEYVTKLEESGFIKHSDNGEEGMEGYVYTSSFTKENLTVTLSHVLKFDKTYVSVSEDLPLSEHLIYKDEYVAGITADAKTSLHMLELADNGNSFVIQLKNGHFIIHDGGNVNDAPYLLDYLEELTPGDEKPVIEAWFITHAHIDHYGALKTIVTNPESLDRIYVDGIYYLRSNSNTDAIFYQENSLENADWYIVSAAKALKNQNGESAKLYRPQLGQRYYFCDIVLDICFTLEQLTVDSYNKSDYNDTSLWVMHYIEDQKFLCGGDSSQVGTMSMMMLYDEAYFDLDVFAVLHHGINVFDYFTDYCKVETLLYTSWRLGSLFEPTSKYARVEENAYLQSVVKESLTHGGGTVILEFPYAVGTSKKAAACDWRYHNGTLPERKVLE